MEAKLSRAEYRALGQASLQKKIFAANGIDPEKRYTYADYASWGDDVPRCELIDGKIYNMAAPTINHQRVAGKIYTQLSTFLSGKTCEPFISPVDVRLDYNEADEITVQPDIIVVCDPKKTENGKHCLGAPDLVIEVLSPSTASRDHLLKLTRYEQYGVREYWLVDPDVNLAKVFLFADGKREYKVYENVEKIPVTILDGFEIEL